MCGIVVILSKNNSSIINNLLQGLSLIQNRGYDSIGICIKRDKKFDNIFDNESFINVDNNFNIIKYASENTSDSFVKLKTTLLSNNIKSTFAIGHTRWATHGSKTVINAHPHISFHKQFILVHNGIINNYNILKDFLIEKNYTFISETDTEVIVNLLEYYYLYEEDSKNNIKQSIEKLNNTLKGTWALAIINVNEKDNIYITRHGSPLVLGYSENLFICSSEINGFAGLILNYIILNNNDIVIINKNDYTSIQCNNYKEKIVKNEELVDTCHPYDNWTLKEIMEQPYYINCALNNGGRIINNKIKLGGLDKLYNLINHDLVQIKHIMLFGCGTSYNVCLLAKHYFGNSKILHIIDASEFIEEDIPRVHHSEKILCIFCSQSGETIDIVKCIEVCKKYNCLTYGVVNVVDSLISRIVNCGTYINAGPEIGVASTKSFTNSAIILSLIGYIFNYNIKNVDAIESLRNLSKTITNMFKNIEIINKIEEVSEYIVNNNINNIFILGKSKLFSIANEISLKIKELCYIHAEGYSASSLKHGPFALLDKSNLTILLIDYYDKKNLQNLESTYNEIISRNTNLLIISNNIKIKNTLNNTDVIFVIISSIEYYNEIIFNTVLQLLAYNISIKKNINPDKPRNLAKVVTVE